SSARMGASATAEAAGPGAAAGAATNTASATSKARARTRYEPRRSMAFPLLRVITVGGRFYPPAYQSFQPRGGRGGCVRPRSRAFLTVGKCAYYTGRG